MNYWKNLKIGLRLAIGISTVLILLLIVAGASYYGLSSGNDNFSHYRSLARQTSVAGVINSELLMARLNVKEFLLKGTDESVVAVEEAIHTLVKDIEESKSLFEESKEEQEIFAKIAEGAKIYQEGFSQVVDLRKKTNVAVDEMNELGPKIERALTAVMHNSYKSGNLLEAYHAGEALQSFLLIRLYVNRFFADNK